MTYDSTIFADEVEESKETQAEKDRRELQLREHYREIYGTPSGREVIADILAQCGLFKEAFTGSSRTFYNEGKRSIGIFIHRRLERATHEGIQLMMDEKEGALRADMESKMKESIGRLKEAQNQDLIALKKQLDIEMEKAGIDLGA